MTGRGLINATEMYVKVLFELAEDGVVPKRARLAERLGVRAPTVSQTVSRLERLDLVSVGVGGRITCTDSGWRLAVRVMRKHRVIEVLLHEVIGLEFEHLHREACRWEHVVSDEVERRMFAVCSQPRFSPYGNPIPELDAGFAPLPWRPASLVVRDGPVRAVIGCLSDRGQEDTEWLRALRVAGLLPGVEVLAAARPGGVLLHGRHGSVACDARQAGMLLLIEPAQHGDAAALLSTGGCPVA